MKRKKWLTIVSAMLLSVVTFAQNNQHKTIAPFSITLVDGRTYKYTQLQKNTETVLIYFSSTCEHCRQFVKALIRHQNKLQNMQIVMVSNESLGEVKIFDGLYSLSVYPNIKIGVEDNSLLVQKYYNVQQFPYVVCYDKYGKFNKHLPSEMTPEDMVAQLKKNNK